MQKLLKLFDSSPQGTIFTNHLDLIIRWNPAAEAIFGIPSQEALGRKLSDIIAKQGMGIIDRWEKGLEESDFHLLGEIVSRSGERHLIEFIISHGVDEHGDGFKIVFANDISHHWFRNGQLQKVVSLETTINIVNTILQVTMQDTAFKQKLEMVLDLILTIPRLKILPMGAILLAGKNPFHLKLKVHKGLTMEHVEACSIVPENTCYCGKAAAEERVTYEGNFLLPPGWDDAPCRKLYPEAVHYSVPIKSSFRLMGVLVLFLERPLTKDHPEIETMMALANILSGVIEREELLREQEDLITHLKGVNTSLQDEKKFSESVISSLIIGLLILDPTEKIIACNPTGRQILSKFFPVELEGKTISEIVGEELAEAFLGNQVAIAQDTAPRKSVNFISPTGEIRLIEYISFPRWDSAGNSLGTIICFTDITEADRLHKKLEKMNRFSTIAEIASAVAHEVRNPLAGIKALAQGVEAGLDPQDNKREPLGRISKQVDRLNTLLSDFFTYARPPKPRKKLIDLTEIIENVTHLIHSRAQKINVSIKNMLPLALPEVSVDAHQMQQVFLNIFLNALDALNGPGTIEITAEETALNPGNYSRERFPGINEEEPLLALKISDSGPGIAPEILENLFEPFFTTKTTGSGLGLSIVLRIMKGHQANIYVESIVNQGSNFFLFFKIDQSLK
ncbi:MAG: PAS domain-containing protein [Proteobacteria bacterium]|nr:PAS domain-containing protein [Pseudomonadota bacterium]MBU1688555.1 PAS domain-containing protein [Pseudomonadota bacterium]